VVDDGFEWTDKTTSPWNSMTVEGVNTDKSPMVRLVSPRKKKAKKIEGEDGTMLFHQSKSLSYRGVVSDAWVSGIEFHLYFAATLQCEI
jgi:hypothetical protein